MRSPLMTNVLLIKRWLVNSATNYDTKRSFRRSLVRYHSRNQTVGYDVIDIGVHAFEGNALEQKRTICISKTM